MKKGRVVIGFSAPFVGLYKCEGGAVTFTNGMRLARGVDVDVNPEVSEDNEFYADNTVAESEGGEFKKGTVTYTVDGLLDAADRFIYGRPEPEKMNIGDKQINVTKDGNKSKPPYVGTGFVVAYQSEGVETYEPVILPKVKFKPNKMGAKTAEGQKNYQTQILEATICREDSVDRNWRWRFEEQATEEEAIAILATVFNVANAEEPAEAQEGNDG